MTAPLTAFPTDRSQRWILVPGASSTRQIEIRNDSDRQIDCRLRVEEPATASPSPAVLSIQPHCSKVADVVFLAGWSPAQEHRVIISMRDARGLELCRFSHEIIAADSWDCTVGLELREGIVIDNALAGLKLWCTVASRSSTPRRFEIDFAPHASLRFPERRIVTLAPGESTAFEVPVEWDRAVRDARGWNHPPVLEVSVPVGDGCRTATLPWDNIQERLARYLTPEDNQAKLIPAQPLTVKHSSFVEKLPGQLKYEELVELKRLEQSVVASAQVRGPSKPSKTSDVEQRRLRLPSSPLVTIGLAFLALVVAGFFYLRPSAMPAADHLSRIVPLKLSTASLTHATTRSSHARARNASAPDRASAAFAHAKSKRATETSSYRSPARQRSKALAAAPQPQPLVVPTIDRTAMVELGGLEAYYTRAGRAVTVYWSGYAQAGAVVQVLDFNGRVIARRVIHGGGSGATLTLPSGYHGSVSVEVTAFGYHGEHIVEGVSLAAQD